MKTDTMIPIKPALTGTKRFVTIVVFCSALHVAVGAPAAAEGAGGDAKSEPGAEAAGKLTVAVAPGLAGRSKITASLKPSISG